MSGKKAEKPRRPRHLPVKKGGVHRSKKAYTRKEKHRDKTMD